MPVQRWMIITKTCILHLERKTIFFLKKEVYKMNTKTINIQVLALLGDAVLSLYIREKLLKQGINNANKLNASAVPYVSAKGQVRILDKLTKDNFLTEEELDIVKRGRNNKKENHPKNTDIITYKLSTGFEALLGDLYLNNKDRLKEILEQIEVK